MKQTLLILMAVALVGCGKEAVSSEDANSLNAEVVRQGLEKEIEKLRAKNKALEATIAAAKKAPPPQPKPNLQVAPRPLPKGVIRMDERGRPTFSVLNQEAAAEFYSGMHLDDLKKLYGNPFTFPGVNKNSPHAGYSFHNKDMYPENIYNPGTEKIQGRVSFYLHRNTLKCVAVKVRNLFTTPYGKSVGWNLLNGPQK